MSGDSYLNLQPGTIINGRYEVVKCLGTGSMGMVYACRHRELSGHLVAMKVLFAEVARDEIAAQRFRNEIVASYGVSNPNVVRAYEYFKDGDLVAFTMEYIGGGDLADRLNQDDLIPVDEAVRMLCQMCTGVQAIHDAGIIHRDLKPENILLSEQGDIKITDFGIARTGSGPKLTEHGGVVGTIDYVSPEYLERGQVDARSDIYALGVLAYEMIAGRPPYKGKSVIETMTLRLKTDPEPPHVVRPECPERLSEIILRAMTRDPAERYQTAGEMLDELSAFREGGDGKEKRPHPRMQTSRASAPGGSRAPAPLAAEVALASAFGNQFGGVVESEEISENAPTSRFSADAVRKAREQADLSPSSKGASSSFHNMGQFPSVLGERPEKKAKHAKKNAEQAPARPAQIVTVSDSHLSAERMKELVKLYRPQTSIFATVFKLLIVFVLVTGAGLFALGYYRPELFGNYDFEQLKQYIANRVK